MFSFFRSCPFPVANLCYIAERRPPKFHAHKFPIDVGVSVKKSAISWVGGHGAGGLWKIPSISLQSGFFSLVNSANCVSGLWGPADVEPADLSVCFLRGGRLHLDVLGVSLGLLMEAKE